MTDQDETTSKPIDDDEDEEEDEDADLQKLQAEIARMEEEAARITRETEELEQKKTLEATGGNSAEGSDATATKQSVEANSIYIGQVDYSATPEELVQHFHSCGTVERVTIVCDKFTGRPKGFAYMEFDSPTAVENAVKLDGSQFRGREIKVTPKRVNQPGYNAAAAATAGMATRGRGGRGRGGRGGRAPGRFYRGGRGAYRGGGRASGFHPYY